MFDIQHPAKNIQILTDYLQSIHSDDIVYRGQEKDYNTLLPSFYRKKISRFKFDQARNQIIFQADRYNYFLEYDVSKDTQQNIAKRVTMNRLMGEFGKSFGNVIAQQYGINSECLDVTSDLNVAAFFATHSWPHYDSVIDSSDLGVIYRIPCMRGSVDRGIQHAGTELTLSAVFLSSDSRPIPLLFSCFKYQCTKDEFDNLEQTHNLVLQQTISKPLLCNTFNLEDIVCTCFAERYPQLDIASLYSNTRISRQKAGFFIPSFVFKSYVPSKLKVVDIRNTKAYSPSFAIHDAKVAIEDILAYPGIERYYFHHDVNISSQYSREYLWPAREEDNLFDILYRWCSDGCRNYLNKLNIEIDDKENGVIDRGYYK